MEKFYKELMDLNEEKFAKNVEGLKELRNKLSAEDRMEIYKSQIQN